MKDYFKYLTVGEIKDQIRDTFSSAKQKLIKIANPINITPSFVNQKFYNYVSQIKKKQMNYDSLMNQSQDLKVLLNKRRKRINESLQKYQRSKRCKTLGSFNYHLQPNRSSFEQNSSDFHSNNRFNNFATQSDSKIDIGCKIGNENYRSQPRQAINYKTQKTEICKQNKIAEKKPQKIHTETSELNKDSQSKKLRSITKVINIRIDNNTLANEKLFSFAKNTIKTQMKQSENVNVEKARKKIQFQTAPAQAASNTEVSNVLTYAKQKKSIHKLLSLSQKALKRIRDRISLNEKMALVQFQRQKKVQCTKILLLKFQFQNLHKRDLKTKLLSAKETYQKAKQKQLFQK